jgi:hypothetical protein
MTSAPKLSAPSPCRVEQFGDELACITCKKRWDTNDTNPPKCQFTGAPSSQIFDELRTIAIGFMKRTEDVENQMNFIVATVYVNLKKRAEQGDAWSVEVVKWMDLEIAKLKDFRERYLICPSSACCCEWCQQREFDEAAGINYKTGEY